MALPVIAGVLRVAADWFHSEAGTAENIMHFGGDQGDAAGLAAALTANVQSNQTNSVANAALIQTWSITPLDGTSATQVFPNAWGGGAADNLPVPATAVIVKMTTALRGRSFRGRIYLPYTTEGAQHAGQLVIDETLMTTAWNDFAAAMFADDFQLVVASYKLESAEPVISLLVEPSVATQRRRQSRLRL